MLMSANNRGRTVKKLSEELRERVRAHHHAYRGSARHGPQPPPGDRGGELSMLEYHEVRTDEALSTERLDTLRADGWELASITRPVDGGHGLVYHLQREAVSGFRNWRVGPAPVPPTGPIDRAVLEVLAKRPPGEQGRVVRDEQGRVSVEVEGSH